MALYLFYSYLYTDEQKSYPKIDLIVAAVLAFIWLAASSAWATAVVAVAAVPFRRTGVFRGALAGLGWLAQAP